MASSLRKPKALSFEGNVPENLRIFLMEYDIYVRAAHPQANNGTKVGILLNLAGREAIERSQNFDFADDEERDDPAIWKEKFRELCQPMRNLTILRHAFNTRSQQPDESFQAYMTVLRNMADSCEFGIMRNELLKDRVVVGIKDDKTRNLLFAEPNLYLERAVELCELHEGAEKAAAALKKDAEVCELKNKQTKKQRKRRNESSKCAFCGYVHAKKRCPAYGKKCAKCGKRNHFAIVCKEESDEESEDDHNKVQEVEYEEYDQGKNYVIE